MPSPMWMPSDSPGAGPKARTTSQVRISATTKVAYQNQRCTFCRISGNRVSPVYAACGSATPQAGGESQNER